MLDLVPGGDPGVQAAVQGAHFGVAEPDQFLCDLSAIYPPSSTPIASAASVPSPSRRTMNSLIWAWNSIPAPIAPPAQIATPRPFSRRNDGQPRRIAPASGGAMVERPGMNFERTS